MESLYRKYRPQTFDDVVGQKHVVATLRRAVLEGRTSHAYLFCGPRGTGKTTMARLLAKALLCEQGPGYLPDGTCEQCQLIASGEHPDVYELDAASNTGVDNVREEIINRVGYAPVRGSYKVYIIDEVHMLTPAAFNALLKTLEEPPSHVVFVMCTTDPQKVLETILSRVQRFDFRPISNDELLARLEYVCNREGFSYDREALQLITLHARGGLRDALSDLERLATYASGSITLDVAQEMLGEVPASTLSEVALALANRDVPALFAQVATLVDSGRDLLQFTRELTAHLRDAYVVAAVGQRPGVVSAQGDALVRLGDEARAFGPADRISRAMSTLGDASSEMRTAPNQRLVLELAFTRIARPEAEVTLDALAERVAVLEARLAQVEAMGPRVEQRPSAPAAVPAAEAKPMAAQRPTPAAPATQPTPASAPRPAGGQPVVPQTAPAAQQQNRQVPPQQAKAPQAPTQPAPQPSVASAAPQHPAGEPVLQQGGTAAVTDAGELQRRWRQVCEELITNVPSRGSLLMNSTIVSDDGATLLVTLPERSSFACKMLERQDVRSIIDPLVARIFGPRHVTYAEAGSKGVAKRAARSAVPPTQAPVAPQTTPRPQRDEAQAPGVHGQGAVAQPHAASAAPQPMRQPVPQQSAPASRAPQQTAPQTGGYLAPWDDVPPYEEVPYSEADAAPYEEDEYYAPSPLPQIPPTMPAQAEAGRPRTAAQQAPQPKAPAAPPAKQQPAQPAAPAAQSTPAPSQAAQQPKITPVPWHAPDAAPAAPKQTSPTPAEQPAPKRRKRSPRANKPVEDEASILSMLTDVFGEGVTMTKEVAATSQPGDDSTEVDEVEAVVLAEEGYDAGGFQEEDDDEFDSSIYDGEDADDEEM